MGFCINCDNRHGCKNGQPLCQTERFARERTEGLFGKAMMHRLGELEMCAACNYFKQCWKREEFDRKRKTAGRGD